MAHDEPMDVNYSDYEIVNFFISTSFGGGSDANIGVEYQMETDVLDLENDELAMLSWLNARVAATPKAFPESGGEVTRGGATVVAEIGANLAGNEYLSQSESNTGFSITDDGGNVASTQRLLAEDDPGLWAALTAGGMSGFKDSDPDGTYSGGGALDNDRIRRVYGEETDGGPYIDSTDDVSVGVFCEKDGFEGQIRSNLYGQMAFLIFEYENRRAEFAPYDPGR